MRSMKTLVAYVFMVHTELKRHVSERCSNLSGPCTRSCGHVLPPFYTKDLVPFLVPLSISCPMLSRSEASSLTQRYQGHFLRPFLRTQRYQGHFLRQSLLRMPSYHCSAKYECSASSKGGTSLCHRRQLRATIQRMLLSATRTTSRSRSSVPAPMWTKASATHMTTA